MSDRSIASRPSLDQVVAIVDFMEKHPSLGLGQLRGLEGREESKKLWLKLTRVVNNISGPTRSMRSWIKYWADKKSAVRVKVQDCGGDANSLCSNIEKKIWDLFLANDGRKNRRKSVKQESQFNDNYLYLEESMDHNHVETEAVQAFEVPVLDAEDRQMAVMDKLVKVMSDQAEALSQLAAASLANSQAMERLAESSHIQARAIDRIATAFESVGVASLDVRSALVDIDATMKRFYNPSNT